MLDKNNRTSFISDNYKSYKYMQTTCKNCIGNIKITQKIHKLDYDS